MTTNQKCDTGFCGIGTWEGTAEVYGGDGTFLGNGTDKRFARTIEEDGRVRIDLAFIGPLKFAGHYYIKVDGSTRFYQGPMNTGMAESVGELAVDGNGFWPVTGLSHKLFLAMTPDGQKQLHFSMMFRGEQLIYTIVSECERVLDSATSGVPGLTAGTSYDLKDSTTGGREENLMHRNGTWKGDLTSFDADLKLQSSSPYEEHVTIEGDKLKIGTRGGLYGDDERISFKTNGHQAWSETGAMVGSYNLSGGRALTGTFHQLSEGVRVWRREIATVDGSMKAVLLIWYRGGQRICAQQGILNFTPSN